MTFQIIVPGRFVEPKDPVSLGFRQTGRFTIEALREGAVVRSVSFEDGNLAPSDNLILNQGLDYLGSSNSFNSSVRVGTGTAPPTIFDTELQSPLPGTISMGSSPATAGSAPDFISSVVRSGTSSIGQFGNNNLTEIRYGGSSNGQAVARALIRDANGDPTAFPIQEDEQLRVSYELRLVPPLEDAFFEVDVAGPRSCTVRALNVNSTSNGWAPPDTFNQGFTAHAISASACRLFTGDLNVVTQPNPMGSQVSGDPQMSVMPYSSGSYKRVSRFSWGSTVANSPSMQTHRVAFGCCVFQVKYDPPLSKNNQQSMYLDYQLEWGRV